MSRDTEYLKQHGWRLIGAGGKYSAKYWDHPEHQPDSHGAFSTTAALKHEQEFEKTTWCDCIKTLDTANREGR